MAKKQNKQEFEGHLKRLEEIVEKIESSDAGLEETLKIFEEGIEVAKKCQKILEDAELKITSLTDPGAAGEKAE